MTVASTANGSSSAGPVRVAGIGLLAVMAIGVLWVALEQRPSPIARSAGAPASDLAFPFSSLMGPALVAGTATFYADDFQGRIMANGKAFDLDDPSVAAANQWPLGTRLRLRRAPGGPWDSTLTPAERVLFFDRTVIVTVQDRGEFTHALDLSRAAFAQLGRPTEGVIRLLIEPLGDGVGALPVTWSRGDPDAYR